MADQIIVQPVVQEVTVAPVTQAVTVSANGPQGATVVSTSVGSTTTGAAGTSASVTNSGTPTAAVLNFTIPQGVKGDTGSQGATGNAATVSVGSTTTLTPGTSATVTNSGSSSAAVFNFGIPSGLKGDTGNTGATGATGAKGDKGDTGNAATITAGSTTTLTPGTSATVTNSGTSSAAVFDFGIPQGAKGDTGATGSTGATGAQGPSGVVAVTSPITNSGTSTSAQLGLDQTALTITESQVTNLTTDLAAKANLAGGNTLTGVQTFGTSGTIISGTTGRGLFVTATTSQSAVPLTAKGTTGQTGNLQEWQDSTGALLARITPTGLGSFTGMRSFDQAYVQGATASTVQFFVKGAASQSANLQEWQDSAGTVLASISSTGQIRGNIAITAGTTNFGGVLNAGPTAPSQIGAVIRGAASQSANLQEWQDSTGTVQTLVNSSGGFTTNQRGTFGTTALSALAHLTVAQGNAGRVSLGVQNTQSSNTGDLVSYFNSASTVLGGRNANAQIYTGSTAPLTTAVGGATTAASGTGTTATLTTTSNHGLAVGDRITVAGVTPTGYNGTFIVTAAATNSVSYANATTGAQTVAGTVSVDAQTSIYARSGGTIALNINAPSGVAVPLTKWTVNFSTVGQMTSAGNLQAQGFQTLPNSYVSLKEANSGGLLTMTKQTAATTNPGSGLGTLYFRDGTTGGTLKLVVRAGAAGAETTILDNIPQ